MGRVATSRAGTPHFFRTVEGETMQDPMTAGDRMRDTALGRLRLPSAGPDAITIPAGRSTIQSDGVPIGLWYVPRTEAKRFVIVLHGAGGTAESALQLLLPHADERGLMLFAPQSLGPTWDMIGGGYGPDVARIQHALDRILGIHRVATPTVAICGFSDGASYAISLGLINGDVFDAVLAFSPGFAAPTGHADHPAFFLSHGRSDRVLPIDLCSRRLVPMLEKAGFDVDYHEFDGGHEVPAPVVHEALDWLSKL
jgi:phospholipase/carboxylesterase